MAFVFCGGLFCNLFLDYNKSCEEQFYNLFLDYIDTKKGGQWPPNLIIITIDC